jgi:hypothetical protein
MHSKDIRSLRYVYLFESVGFVGLAMCASAHIGFAGVLLSAILCAILFRGLYTVRRIAAYFHIPATTVCWGWLRRSLLASALLLPFVVTAPHVATITPQPLMQLVVSLLWAGGPALLALGTMALPRDVKAEVLGKLLAHFRTT